MNKADFFISYTAADEAWAEWTAFILEERRYSVLLQKWDFAAGGNFVLAMQRAASESSRTIGILSPDYLTSKFVKPEWAAAFAKDPEGLKRSLVLVRVRECVPSGLLKPLIYIDLVGLDQDQARERLLGGASGQRAKPSERPRFPGGSQGAKSPAPFPGSGQTAAAQKRTPEYIPKIRKPPTDLEKRRFIERAFLSIVEYFKNALEELAQQNENVETDFKEIGPSRYRAEIFIDGRSRALCRFWIAGNGIAYSEVSSHLDTDESYNEMLTLSERELVLTALMRMFIPSDDRFDTTHLSPEAAADYLWRRFISRIEGS